MQLNPASQSRLVGRLSICGVIMLGCGIASGATYEIGPGKAYASIGAAPWSNLVAGDTVKIYWRTEPYREKILLSRSGTAAAHVHVVGVPGPNGELPILDGQNATFSPQFKFGWAPLQDFGLVIVSRAGDQPWGSEPSYIDIEGLETRNACVPNTYKDVTGATRSYDFGASGVYINAGAHISIRKCTIDGNGNGLFVKSGGDVSTLSQDILVENCYIYGNGNSGRIYEHNIYTEALGIVFQGNHIGPLRAGAGGNTLKDRSSGTVIRYNWIELGAPAHVLDLVEAQDGYPQIAADPSYHQTYVYGNILVNGPQGATTLVHYGSDCLPNHARRGTLYFYNNTVVNVVDQKNRWRSVLFLVDSNQQVVDLRNNILYNGPATAGSPAPEFDLLNDSGVVNCGVNWISPGWRNGSTALPFTGKVRGADKIITNPTNNPGFVGLKRRNLALAAGSHCINRAGRLPAKAKYPVTGEYNRRRVVARISNQSGEPRDLGAFSSHIPN
jgi:hypothetical protein